MKPPIYMDNHATTPVDPRVLEAMLPYLREDFGNAASRSHVYGWRAEAAVERARKQVAALMGASEKEIIFTSGATESNNLAIKGVVEAYAHKGDHVVTLRTEHKAVLDPCKRLERVRQERLDELKRMRLEQLAGEPVTVENLAELAARYEVEADETYRRWAARPTGGARVTYLEVERDGRVSLERLAAALTDRTVLVSVMLANNEVGVVQPLAEIGRLCRERGVLLHVDAVQGVGKVPFDVEALGVDLASLSAHKMYGPKGVGALYVRSRPRVRLVPLLEGGGHERGHRSGTLNVAGIVGLGQAAELCRQEQAAEAERLLRLRERLRTGLQSQLEGMTVNGSLEHRLPGNLNVSFAWVVGDALLMALKKEVAVSSGSACTSASLEPSYVLRALGVEEELALNSLRFGLGRFTTEEEVDQVVRVVVDTVRRLREENPLYPRQAAMPLAAPLGVHKAPDTPPA